MDTNDLIYAAGFIDGEGCFTTVGNRGFRLTISSVDKSILQWFQEKFKGNVNNQFLPKNPKHNMAWKWVLCRKEDLATFTLAVLPYMKLKKSQAEIMVKYLTSYPNRKNKKDHSAQDQNFIKTKEQLKHLKTVHC
jgi:hypothetical protein